MERLGIYEALSAYSSSDFYPYHMPGHKRSKEMGVWSDIFQLDITEIDGFDNLHQAQGLIKEAQERASKLYGAQETFFLVNGSTCGILAAILAVTGRQDEVIIARNCHKSVYHAALLQDLTLHYLYPGQISEFDIADAVRVEQVEEALQQYPESKAVVITSPTYEGVIADIEAIAGVVHRYGKILIVDEAHGAHLGLAKPLPESAVRQGADLVIHSLHKTLPAMTQTALLHRNGTRINREKLCRYLSMVQTSSPSYVFMANMDSCISFLEKNADSYYERMIAYQNKFLEQMQNCRLLRIGSAKVLQDRNDSKNNTLNDSKQDASYRNWDYGKLVISVKNTPLNGQQLYDILREEYHLQMEMAADSYVLAMMTLLDNEEGWQRLADALRQIDDRIADKTTEKEADRMADSAKASGTHLQTIREADTSEVKMTAAETKMTIAEAFAAIYDKEMGSRIPLSEAEGKIAGEFVNLYPPGIPILVPGEVIGKAQIEKIEQSIAMGLCVQGVDAQGRLLFVDAGSRCTRETVSC